LPCFAPGGSTALDLRQLRYFLAIGDSGALSYAARTLDIAQSAVSHHLAEMEARLGVERHPRGVTLTPAGRTLYEHARTIVAAVARAESEIQAFSSRTGGPVSVGLSHTVTHQISLPLIKTIKRECPGIISVSSRP
jgi:LysR family transcriptional regulator, nitrogen assimilation regulatory protein